MPPRKKPLRRDGPALERGEHPKADAGKAASPKTCAHCGTRFTPARSLQNVCGPVCARRKVEADKKAERETFKARKEAIKTIPDLIKEAQVEFNAYIRARDARKDCICCGLPLHSGADVGGGFDAGHYRSTGSAAHLRFNEHNCHGQRKVCNRYGAGRAVDYRIGLVARIGLAAVEALEADNRIHRWTREELIAIKNEYRQKRRELEKQRAA